MLSPATTHPVLRAVRRLLRVPFRRVAAALLLSALALGCTDADLARDVAPRMTPAAAIRTARSARPTEPGSAHGRAATAAARPRSHAPVRERHPLLPHPCVCTQALIALATVPRAPAVALQPRAPRSPTVAADRVPAGPSRERLLRPPAARAA